MSWERIHSDEAGYARVHQIQDPVQRWQAMRTLALHDLYYLMTVVCGRKDVRHPWVYRRAREVEADPDGHLDLWARGHYKSSLITFGKTIQEILANPEITCLIMSFNLKRAAAFLGQIKAEFETNRLMNWLFPDVLWGKTLQGGQVDLAFYNKAQVWSGQKIVVRRKGRPKESTIEVGGMLDGQPVGVHPDLVIYDDVVTRDSVRTPDMIRETTQAFKESLALGAGKARRRMIGTRWHHADTYAEVIENKTMKPRLHPARDPVTGRPVLMREEELDALYTDMGPVVYAAQMDLDPTTESDVGFDEATLRYYSDHRDGEGQNVYIVVDPAQSQERDSSYTAMMVIGLGPDGNFYWLDGIRDRLSLDQRIKALLGLHRKWSATARVRGVGYETYGAGKVDKEAIEAEQDRLNYRFEITALTGSRGRGAHKSDRIPLLEPQYRAGRWYWPVSMRKKRHDGTTYDLVAELKNEEFLVYPFGRHPDGLDAMSRINDPELEIVWPKPRPKSTQDLYDTPQRRAGTTWMSA